LYTNLTRETADKADAMVETLKSNWGKKGIFTVETHWNFPLWGEKNASLKFSKHFYKCSSFTTADQAGQFLKFRCRN